MGAGPQNTAQPLCISRNEEEGRKKEGCTKNETKVEIDKYGTMDMQLSFTRAHAKHTGLDTATISGLSDQGTEHGESVLQCLGNTLHYLVSFF